MGIIGVIYYLQEVAPFGDKSLLTIDFFHQYGPMLGELFDRIKNHSNLLYSFSMGMGLPFFRNFFNYLASPFNIIIWLFNHDNLLMSYSFIIGFKAVTSCVSMCYYLKVKFKCNNFCFVALSLMYGFSAYFTAYYWNMMWLDGMVFLPLIALGIENIVNEKKPLLYILSLSLMLFANYFIGYMLCIFSVLYFGTYLFINTTKFDGKSILKKVGKFAISSLLAGGICAIALIPLYSAIKGISATSDSVPLTQYYSFTFKEFIYNHMSAVGSTVLKSGITSAPNVSCGILAVSLLFVFIISPKINGKTKLGYLSLLAFLVISYFWAPLDFIWHAFHVPNDLPYRYSFIYSFVLVVIGAYGIKNIKDLKPLWVTIVYVLSMVFVLSSYTFGFENISKKMFVLNFIILTIMYLSYILGKYYKKAKKLAICFMILAVCFECIIGINNNWEISHDLKSFYYDYDDVKEDLKFLEDNNQDFYRVEKSDMLSFNDNSWYGYPGVVAFSSMEYENLAVLVNNLGMPGNEINSFYFKNNTPIYNMMFDLKYILGDVDDSYYSLYYEGNNNIYKSNYALGLMYGVDKGVLNWNYNFVSPFKNQSDFIYKTSGVSKIFNTEKFISKEIMYEQDGSAIVKYTMKNPGKTYYYYISSANVSFVYSNHSYYYLSDDISYRSAIDNEISIFDSINYNEKYIISENSYDDEVVFYVGYDSYVNDDFDIYTIDESKLSEAYNYYLNNMVSIVSYEESYIEGVANFKEDLICYTSIPYDEGWSVYIDGKEVATYMIGNALLGFDVESGVHNIVLKYSIPNIGVSAMISLLSIGGVFLLNSGKGKMVIKKDKNLANK